MNIAMEFVTEGVIEVSQRELGEVTVGVFISATNLVGEGIGNGERIDDLEVDVAFCDDESIDDVYDGVKLDFSKSHLTGTDGKEYRVSVEALLTWESAAAMRDHLTHLLDLHEADLI